MAWCNKRNVPVGLVAGLWFASFAACAHQAAGPAETVRSEQELASLRTQNAAYLKQIEELENRVFILTDRVESQKVASLRVAEPKLPKVTLHPGAPSSTAGGSGGAPSAYPASSFASSFQSGEPDVEYVGDAARTSGKRPVLRLYGTGKTIVAEPAAEAEDEGGTEDDAAGEESEDGVPPRRPVHQALRRPSVHVSPAPAPSASPLRMPIETTGGKAMGLYRKALETLQAGNQADAAASFRDFLRVFPSHDLSDNAQYWLGECYYDLKDYTGASREFRRVVAVYPQGNKVPDALLKLAFTYLAMGNDQAARATLDQVVKAYPRHEAATRAGAKLGELRGEKKPAGAAETPATARASIGMLEGKTR